MSQREIKITFELTDEQKGPFPVSTETLWCTVEGEYYRVKNIPFFIDNLSFDDLISIGRVGNELFEIRSIVSESGNSTIWIYFKKKDKRIIKHIVELGCGVESGVLDDYYAINIPSEIEYSLVFDYLEECERKGTILVDYPSIRH